jgi:hypothetical protein
MNIDARTRLVDAVDALKRGATPAPVLPQYAAQAVLDLELSAKRVHSKPYAQTMESVAAMIRLAVHVVLPANGEIYRSNDRGGAMPSEEECLSFAGLPAPATCFEYPWSHQENGDDIAPQRITLVLDGKQTHPGPAPPDMTFVATILSVVRYKELGSWTLVPYVMAVATPLYVESISDIKSWGPRCAPLRNLITLEEVTNDSPGARELFGSFYTDLTAVVQCCHALRAGARFEEHHEQSKARRLGFAKYGAGDFTYHVLKLPGRAVAPSAPLGGMHASPRLHVRRAHIRKLPSGLLAFVRQCFVGDQDAGTVGKHYQIARKNQAPHDESAALLSGGPTTDKSKFGGTLHGPHEC